MGECQRLPPAPPAASALATIVYRWRLDADPVGCRLSQANLVASMCALRLCTRPLLGERETRASSPASAPPPSPQSLVASRRARRPPLVRAPRAHLRALHPAALPLVWRRRRLLPRPADRAPRGRARAAADLPRRLARRLPADGAKVHRGAAAVVAAVPPLLRVGVAAQEAPRATPRSRSWTASCLAASPPRSAAGCASCSCATATSTRRCATSSRWR